MSNKDSWWKGENHSTKDSWWQQKSQTRGVNIVIKEEEKISNKILKDLHKNCVPYNQHAVIINKKVLKEITKELIELRGVTK